MKKILVANRGEIAVRVMETAKKMGISTVAVYSEADINAPHVLFADEAVLLGPPPSSESYLLGDKIIAFAKKLNVDGIHPGYGFLSENAQFQQAVEKAGMIFIGPNTEAILTMGSKLAAKDAVKAYDIPMVPGLDKAITDIPKAKAFALTIGYPILIKASAGGGGKGMRVVEKESDFESQMKRAISEAQNAFGDGSVFIEKYITKPRHIEIQIISDQHGNHIYLMDRECSIQRRHQKVIEEAPSSCLTPKLRKEMGEAAVKVAQSCNYEGAGTVEFLLEGDKFYFLEMNTRLQVEHPVTELITGLDLVELQIRVARGEKLPFTQEDIAIKGHAIELRIYAENTLEGFVPSVGKLTTFRIANFDFVRLDSGFREGMEIPIFYDPMIAKLIVYGDNRSDAISKMTLAIRNSKIEGVETTLSFGEFTMLHPSFISGNFDTNFVKKYYTGNELLEPTEEELKVLKAIALLNFNNQKSKITVPF